MAIVLTAMLSLYITSNPLDLRLECVQSCTQSSRIRLKIRDRCGPKHLRKLLHPLLQMTMSTFFEKKFSSIKITSLKRIKNVKVLELQNVPQSSDSEFCASCAVFIIICIV